MDVGSLLAAIAPVLLVLALGFAAGKHRSFDADQAKGFSGLALGYALPAALFLGMAHLDGAMLLRQGPIVLVMLLGYGVLFVALYWGLRRFGMDKLRATLLGYAMSSTATPIYGLTVLGPLYGQHVSAGIVGLVALVTNLAQVSVAIFLLQSAGANSTQPDRAAAFELEQDHTSTDRGPAVGTAKATVARTMPASTMAVMAATAPSVWSIIARSAANPLVWCPVLGGTIALSGLRLSPYASAALHPLAVSAAGVAIFASGLALAEHPVKLTSRAVLLGALVCLVVQPALFFAMIKAARITGPMAQATFVASAMPPSTLSVLFAQQYGQLEAETAGMMLAATVAMAVVLPAVISISAYL